MSGLSVFQVISSIHLPDYKYACMHVYSKMKFHCRHVRVRKFWDQLRKQIYTSLIGTLQCAAVG
jgi:hypothetical protein